MDLDQLAAFDRIVREGSFSRAAVALGVGQPAVSARIQALERAVGGALFTRGRRVALTALGEAFLPFARRAVEVLAEGVDAAQQAQTGRRGRVRLAALGSLAGGLVGPALARFLRAHPGVECLVRSGHHERVVTLLLDGQADLGILVWPCTEAGTAELQPVLRFREPVVLVTGPQHPLARLGATTAAELCRAARPLFRLRWWQAPHPALSALADQAGSTVDLPMESARQLLLEGVGAGFFPRTYLADELARGALAEIPVRGLATLVRETALVRRPRAGPLSPAAAELVEALRREAARLGVLAETAGPRRVRPARPSGRRQPAQPSSRRQPAQPSGRRHPAQP